MTEATDLNRRAAEAMGWNTYDPKADDAGTQAEPFWYESGGQVFISGRPDETTIAWNPAENIAQAIELADGVGDRIYNWQIHSDLVTVSPRGCPAPPDIRRMADSSSRARVLTELVLEAIQNT